MLLPAPIAVETWKVTQNKAWNRWRTSMQNLKPLCSFFPRWIFAVLMAQHSCHATKTRYFYSSSSSTTIAVAEIHWFQTTTMVNYISCISCPLHCHRGQSNLRMLLHGIWNTSEAIEHCCLNPKCKSYYRLRKKGELFLPLLLLLFLFMGKDFSFLFFLSFFLSPFWNGNRLEILLTLRCIYFSSWYGSDNNNGRLHLRCFRSREVAFWGNS